MEQALLKKLEMLWGLPIFYTDENNEKLQSFGTFPENGNPLFGSQELVQTLISRTNTQAVPVVYKILDKIYFICIHSGFNYYLSGPVCIEPLSYVEIHQFYKDCHMSSYNHQFNWWFIIGPPKGYPTARPKGRISQALLLVRYKAVPLESSFLDSSACSLIYFWTASSVIFPIVST